MPFMVNPATLWRLPSAPLKSAKTRALPTKSMLRISSSRGTFGQFDKVARGKEESSPLWPNTGSWLLHYPAYFDIFPSRSGFLPYANDNNQRCTANTSSSANHWKAYGLTTKVLSSISWAD